MSTPKGWTGPSETLIWNTSLLKMLFCTLTGVIILNSKSLKNHKKLCPGKHPCWTQVYICGFPRTAYLISQIEEQNMCQQNFTHWSESLFRWKDQTQIFFLGCGSDKATILNVLLWIELSVFVAGQSNSSCILPILYVGRWEILNKTKHFWSAKAISVAAAWLLLMQFDLVAYHSILSSLENSQIWTKNMLYRQILGKMRLY